MSVPVCVFLLSNAPHHFGSNVPRGAPSKYEEGLTRYGSVSSASYSIKKLDFSSMSGAFRRRTKGLGARAPCRACTVDIRERDNMRVARQVEEGSAEDTTLSRDWPMRFSEFFYGKQSRSSRSYPGLRDSSPIPR